MGKQIDRNGSISAVEYFDTPVTAPFVVKIDRSFLETVTLAKQVRVFHFDDATAAWEIGHLLADDGDSQLIQFQNRSKRLKSNAVFVRWNRQIQDPTPLLANQINESPILSDARCAFVRSQLRQRAAATGISALLACAVELEAHQIEVVRRILQDPVQRYLLADEVGLGKTIEACVLIRQCVLDLKQDFAILVLVPAALVSQWRNELSGRFFLESHLDRDIHVVAFDDGDKIQAILNRTTMLVVDEAHHLCDSRMGDTADIYRSIASVAPSIDRVLLLSATPALHNERGFLRMLHLLDPASYPLDGEEAFRYKISHRQTLAEAVAALIPENIFFLEQTIDQLRELFPDDELLAQHTAELRRVIETMPDQGSPVLLQAIDQLHAHLSEVYRLDRRILRHRRRSVVGLTPNRSGAEIVRYRSSDRAALTAALDDWRFSEATKLDITGSDKLWRDRARTFWQVLDRASQYPCSGPGMVGFLARQTAMVGDFGRFEAISRCLGRAELFEHRVDALIETLRPVLGGDAQYVIFCSDTISADLLAKRVARELAIIVDRHDPSSDAWMTFNHRSDHRVLVCDRRAEEGLNLQGGKKVVVHFDVPLNPNRIEQRLGRVDRYGGDATVRSIVLACEDDPYEMAWVGYIDTALKVFDRSIASLQYLLEQTVRSVAGSLFADGPEKIIDLAAESSGELGLIEREIKAIDQQDALDALSAPPATMIDKLSDVDGDWLSISSDTGLWLEQTLQFGRFSESHLIAGTGPAAAFRYVYSTSARRHTLMPLRTFVDNCAEALDTRPSVPGDRTIRTVPYTFSRRTALQHRARAGGVRLLRFGDPLLDGVTALIEADDRGRSFALWRFAPGYVSNSLADIYFRFDFIFEADAKKATATLRQHQRYTRAAASAMRRRGDSALPPFYRTVWLDSELAPVSDHALLSLLERPYTLDPTQDDSVDLNLDARGWQALHLLKLPELAHWADLCNKARGAAERALRVAPEVIERLARAEEDAARSDNRRLGQYRARLRASASPREEAELILEDGLAAALNMGITSPAIRLDVVGAIFLSASSVATREMASGY